VCLMGAAKGTHPLHIPPDRGQQGAIVPQRCSENDLFRKKEDRAGIVVPKEACQQPFDPSNHRLPVDRALPVVRFQGQEGCPGIRASDSIALLQLLGQPGDRPTLQRFAKSAGRTPNGLLYTELLGKGNFLRQRLPPSLKVKAELHVLPPFGATIPQQ